jgi:hypothetical protein
MKSDELVSLKLALTLDVRSVVTHVEENRLVVKETWLALCQALSTRDEDMCLSSTQLDQEGQSSGVTTASRAWLCMVQYRQHIALTIWTPLYSSSKLLLIM